MPVGDRPRREDGELADFLKRIQEGDEGAARELLQRYEPEVRLVVRRQLPRLLRSRFDSLDFLQSVWGSFFRRMRDAPTDFEDSRHLVAFLARAAKNKVIDEYRRAASLKNDMHREEPLWGDGRRPKEVADPIAVQRGNHKDPVEATERREFGGKPQQFGLRHEVDLVENGDERTLDLGQMREQRLKRCVQPIFGVDHNGDEIRVPRPLPSRLSHGAVETTLRLKDSGRIDQDHLR